MTTGIWLAEFNARFASLMRVSSSAADTVYIAAMWKYIFGILA